MKRDKKYIEEGPFSGTCEEVTCPLCPSPPIPQLIYKRPNGVGIWQCPDCQIMYASPRFTERSLLDIYESPDFGGGSKFSKYKDWNYEEWKNSGDETYITSRLKVGKVRQYLSTADKILDVGCGVGLFVREAREQGLYAEGIEPSQRLCDIAKNNIGAEIHNIMIEDFQPPAKFKGVILWDVLEHVYDPVRILEKCSKLTEKGGYLFVSVPNFEGITDRIQVLLHKSGLRKGNYNHFGFPWHIYSFNRESLRILLGKAGYTPLEFVAPSHHIRRGTSNIFSKLMEPIVTGKCLGANITCVAQKK